MHVYRRVQVAKKRFALFASSALRGRAARAYLSSLHASARVIQRSWNRYVYRQVSLIRTVAKTLIVRLVRGWRARRFRRLALAAIPVLQSTLRMWAHRRPYTHLRAGVSAMHAMRRMRPVRAA